jgi:F0F1-type ATP synthase epsilon subunit
MQVTITNPSATLFQGEVKLLIAPAIDGEIGIMQDHENALMALTKGDVKADDQVFKIDSGFLIVSDNVVNVLVD